MVVATGEALVVSESVGDAAKPWHVIWLVGAGCDGCTMAMLGAAEPGIEDLLLGRLPDVPQITLVHPGLALESGQAYRSWLEQAARGDLAPFLLVLEGSVMDESLAGEGSFSRLGTEDDRAVTIADWVSRLAPQAEAVVALSTAHDDEVIDETLSAADRAMATLR